MSETEIKKRDWLLEKRVERNLGRQEVAKLIGTSTQFYSYIENGKRRPSPEIAMKIAKVLKFDWTLFYKKKNY